MNGPLFDSSIAIVAVSVPAAKNVTIGATLCAPRPSLDSAFAYGWAGHEQSWLRCYLPFIMCFLQSLCAQAGLSLTIAGFPRTSAETGYLRPASILFPIQHRACSALCLTSLQGSCLNPIVCLEIRLPSSVIKATVPQTDFLLTICGSGVESFKTYLTEKVVLIGNASIVQGLWSPQASNHEIVSPQT